VSVEISSESGRPLETSRAEPTRFRPDIEGLRAVAIGTVLAYHAGIKVVPGGFVGVDVFFVISGFLITGLLVREVETTARVSFGRFYARRAKRLLPAASLVLVVTTALVLAVGNVVDRRVFGGDIVAAAGYVLNWRLAARSVDYLAEGVGMSPVQHFWSLSVEEQFYVVWPLLLLLVTLVARRRRSAVRPLMALALVGIVVPSLAWSVVYTTQNPAQAFLVTPTRLWELGLGGLVAVCATWWTRIPRHIAILLGYGGLFAIGASALLVKATDPWPGALALAPVLGAAAVIIAGATGAAPRLLSWRLAVWVGALSYSLYLWHWPLLIAAQWQWGELGQAKSLLVVAFVFLPAWLSYRYLEDPIRRSHRLSQSTTLTLALGASFTAIGVVAGLVLALLVPGSSDQAAAKGVVGGRSLTWSDGKITGITPMTKAPKTLTPQPQAATEDMPSAYAQGCQAAPLSPTPVVCEYGKKDSRRRVVVAGDSKALQWSDALRRIGTERHWRIDIVTKSGCAFADAYRDVQGTAPSCRTFNESALAKILAHPPDAVLVSQRHRDATGPDGSMDEQTMINGLVRMWSTITNRGIPIIVLLDNPAPVGVPGGEVYRCVADHLDSLEACSFSRGRGTESSGSPTLRAAAKRVKGVTVVDMSDALCTPKICPPVIGGVLVYRQGSHITNTYALSIQEFLARRLRPLVESQ
jgi:peptidoglycan/LPS O-acetylase OafA/YrhL